MDSTRHAGAVLLVGWPGVEIDDGTARALADLRPAGVILFRRNLASPDRLGRVTEALQTLLEPPVLVAIDQEGGRVSRLEPWIGPTPPATRLAAAGADAAFRFGRATGEALASLGINLDFAPVVDLSDPLAPNGIADRSFGIEPARVTHLAGSFLDGLQRAGVAGCLKHFPGLGATAVDSHVELPTVDRDAETLHRLDLEPFRRLAGRSASIMIGHGWYPALGVAPGTPASLAPEIVGGLLRSEIGYGGLVVSDDLEMGAVAPRDVDGSAAVAAIAAGCDLVLYCSDLARAAVARDALAREAERSPRFATRLAESARRVRRVAARWPQRRPDLAAWRAAAARIATIAAGADSKPRVPRDGDATS